MFDEVIKVFKKNLDLSMHLFTNLHNETGIVYKTSECSYMMVVTENSTCVNELHAELASSFSLEVVIQYGYSDMCI